MFWLDTQVWDSFVAYYIHKSKPSQENVFLLFLVWDTSKNWGTSLIQQLSQGEVPTLRRAADLRHGQQLRCAAGRWTGGDLGTSRSWRRKQPGAGAMGEFCMEMGFDDDFSWENPPEYGFKRLNEAHTLWWHLTVCELEKHHDFFFIDKSKNSKGPL